MKRKATPARYAIFSTYRLQAECALSLYLDRRGQLTGDAETGTRCSSRSRQRNDGTPYGRLAMARYWVSGRQRDVDHRSTAVGAVEVGRLPPDSAPSSTPTKSPRHGLPNAEAYPIANCLEGNRQRAPTSSHRCRTAANCKREPFTGFKAPNTRPPTRAAPDLRCFAMWAQCGAPAGGGRMAGLANNNRKAPAGERRG